MANELGSGVDVVHGCFILREATLFYKNYL